MELVILEQNLDYARVRTRISKDELFKIYAERMSPMHGLCGLEHWADLKFDLLLILTDALVANGTITLTPEQESTLTDLRTKWAADRSCTLQTATWEPAYIFDQKDKTKAIRDEYIYKKLGFGFPL